MSTTTYTAARNKITGKFFNGKDFSAPVEQALRNPIRTLALFWDNVQFVTVTEEIGKRYPGSRRQPGGRMRSYKVSA